MGQEQGVELVEIESVAGLMAWIDSVLPENTSQSKLALFYRGHADKNYQLQPGVYRQDSAGRSYRRDESRLYHEMLRRDPAAFSSDTTVFERLARMQHHGLPTRLLDVTESPLVALFFACEDESKHGIDGSITHFSMDPKEVYYQQTLPEMAFVGVDKFLELSSLKNYVCENFIHFIKNEIEICRRDYGVSGFEYLNLLNNSGDLMRGCLELFKGYEIFVAYSVLEKVYGDLEKFLVFTGGLRYFIIDAKNRLFEFDKNISIIFKDVVGLSRMSLAGNLNFHKLLLGLTKFNFAYPPMNSERIKRQRGAFVIFPPAKSDYFKIDHRKEPKIAFIKSTAKKNIIQELAMQGITRSYLFPELEHQVKDICSIYSPSTETSPK